MSALSHNTSHLESSRASTPTPRFACLSVRELVFLILTARSRGLTVTSVDQARVEILRRELDVGR